MWSLIILVEILYWGLWGGVLGCMDITFLGSMCCYCCFVRYFKLRSWVNHLFQICRRAHMHLLSIANVVLAEDWSWRPWSPQMWTVDNFVCRRWQPNSSLGSLWFTDRKDHQMSNTPYETGYFIMNLRGICSAKLRLLRISRNKLWFLSPALACLHFFCKWMSWSSLWDPSSIVKSQ